MTLRDLLLKCTYKKTFNQIYKIYLKGDYKKSEITEFDFLYYKFFEFLKTLPKKENPLGKIYLTHIANNDPEVDVCFLDENKDELFAMDFIDWDDIIDIEVYKTFNCSDFECLAHILHEITFWGFNKEAFEKQKKILRDSIDETER